jgi:hypothetical protein
MRQAGVTDGYLVTNQACACADLQRLPFVTPSGLDLAASWQVAAVTVTSGW